MYPITYNSVLFSLQQKPSSTNSHIWDIRDSLLENGMSSGVSNKKVQLLKSPEISRNDFTRVVTRSMISTPQIQKKEEITRDGDERNMEMKKTIPSPGINKSVQLSQWGLPDVILKNYKAKGIHTMFEWQKECLLQENVLDGGISCLFSS